MFRRNFLFSWLLCFATLTLSPLPALAQKSYDLREMTPEIKQAIENRKARYAELQQLKIQTVVGENNQGLAELLKSSPEARGVIEGENRDRRVIYQAIVDQNGLGNQGMAKVQAVFAEVQRGKARPGELIQLPSGEWVQKT